MTRVVMIVSLFTMLAGCAESTSRTDQTPMPKSTFSPSVIVSDVSLKSEDPYDIISSNIDFLNAQLEEHLRHDELSPDGLRSYYVDYYLAQVNNGGFSQFVYNSRWDQKTIGFVRDGLSAMGARKHLELFNESAAIIDRIGPDGMQKFFASEYFGENKERDTLNEFDGKFFELSKHEDLVVLNSGWLKRLPGLVVMTEAEMKAEVERRASSLADRQERVADALAKEPRFMKLIRALCRKARHELSRVTAGDPTHKYNGANIIAWHFITDKGHHYMVDADGKAMMFNGDSHQQLVVIDVTDEFGPE